MNISVGEAIQRVQSIYSKGVQSKDTRLTDRHIYSCLCSARSTILKQVANKNQFISIWNYQTLPCIEMELAPLHECPQAPQGKTFLRSKYALPQIVSSISGSLMQDITTLDNSLVFDLKTFESFKYDKGKKYTSNKPTYFFRNKFIYLTVVRILSAVPVVAIFHDPVAAYFHPSCNECDECLCKEPYDIDFPIDGELLPGVLQLAYQEALQLFIQMKEDKLNDASDNGDSKGGMIHT